MTETTNGLVCGRRRLWWACPRCGRGWEFNGHRCQECRRIVCDICFDHLDGICWDGEQPRCDLDAILEGGKP